MQPTTIGPAPDDSIVAYRRLLGAYDRGPLSAELFAHACSVMDTIGTERAQCVERELPSDQSEEEREASMLAFAKDIELLEINQATQRQLRSGDYYVVEPDIAERVRSASDGAIERMGILVGDQEMTLIMLLADDDHASLADAARYKSDAQRRFNRGAAERFNGKPYEERLSSLQRRRMLRKVPQRSWTDEERQFMQRFPSSGFKLNTKLLTFVGP